MAQRNEQERQRKAEEVDAAAMRQAMYEHAMERQPVFNGDPNTWKFGDPVLLPDRKHFICPHCRERRHVEQNLSLLFKANGPTVPWPGVACDQCFRENAEEIQNERDVVRLLADQDESRR